MRITLSLTTLTILALSAATLCGQTDDPGRNQDTKRALTALPLDEPAELPQLSNTPESREGSVLAGSQEAAATTVDADGKLRGSSISDRLENIRRRAVDTAISRPFLVADPRESQNLSAGQQGSLPPVKKRSLKKKTPAAPAEKQPVKSEEPEPARQPKPRTVSQPTPSRRSVSTSPVHPKSNVLLTNRASSLSVETVGPKTIVIGREATYQVVMLNMGQMDAQNVVVSISLPSWAEVGGFQATSGKPRVEAESDQMATVKWPLSLLKAKGREQLTLKVIPRDSRPFELGVGWAFAPEHSTAQIQVQEPKLEMGIHGPNEVTFGATELYTISLSNPGTGDAENVVLNLMPLGAQQPIAGSRDLGMLRAGERKTIELELTAHQAGRLQVRAMAFAEGGLRTETALDVIVRRARLDIDVAGPPTSFATTEAAYQVRIENSGDAPAEETILTVALPPGAKFSSSTDGGKFEPEQGLVHWAVGAIRPGAVRIIEWTCEINTAGENRFDVQCTATGQLSAAKSIVTSVEALADLKLRVNDPRGAVELGSDATYEVTVTNRGTKAAEMVQLIGYFSEGIEPVAIRGLRGRISTGQVALEPISVIAPGQEITFRITARALQPGNHVFRAELQCNSPETRLAAEEWTKYYRSTSPKQHEEPAATTPLNLGQRPDLDDHGNGNVFRR